MMLRFYEILIIFWFFIAIAYFISFLTRITRTLLIFTAGLGLIIWLVSNCELHWHAKLWRVIFLGLLMHNLLLLLQLKLILIQLFGGRFFIDNVVLRSEILIFDKGQLNLLKWNKFLRLFLNNEFRRLIKTIFLLAKITDFLWLY